MTGAVLVYLGEALAAYNFGEGHPFGPLRIQAFMAELQRRGPAGGVVFRAPVQARREDLTRFHTPAYVDFVEAASREGRGSLDAGDTPVFPGVYAAAATVVGTVLDAVDRIMAGEARRGFVPIAGLHHARRDRAAGFCVFNDCGVAIEHLRARHALARVAYVDIDVHHGDGVYYGFEADPGVYIVDIHESGHSLYPGSGFADERGAGEAVGTKLNLPLEAGAGDAEFFAAWAQAEALLRRARPQFILFQCGTDSLAGDPLAHLALTEAAHLGATRRLCALADEFCAGRLLALGGGGYNLDNLARVWSGVIEILADGEQA